MDSRRYLADARTGDLESCLDRLVVAHPDRDDRRYPVRSMANAMAKIKRVRTKPRTRCEETCDVLYRVCIDEDGQWIFVCPACLENIKPGNPHYQYGGTSKSKKWH